KQLQDQGKSRREAAIEAARLRLRPIIMTSLAFALGVLPLYLASGASAETQRAVGTGVLGGMISATVLAIILVPVFYVVIRKETKPSATTHPTSSTPSEPSDAGAPTASLDVAE